MSVVKYSNTVKLCERVAPSKKDSKVTNDLVIDLKMTSEVQDDQNNSLEAKVIQISSRGRIDLEEVKVDQNNSLEAKVIQIS